MEYIWDSDNKTCNVRMHGCSVKIATGSVGPLTPGESGFTGSEWADKVSPCTLLFASLRAGNWQLRPSHGTGDAIGL